MNGLKRGNITPKVKRSNMFFCDCFGGFLTLIFLIVSHGCSLCLSSCDLCSACSTDVVLIIDSQLYTSPIQVDYSVDVYIKTIKIINGTYYELVTVLVIFL